MTFETDAAAPLECNRGIADFAGGNAVPVARRIVETPDGRTVAYADTGGAAPDVLLIHGTLVTLEDMWLGPADALAEDFRVVAVDRPGHGKSIRSRFVDASPWRQAEILHDAMSALGLRRPTLVGHSSGGAVALAYAMQFPKDVAGVVAVAPICFPEPRLEQMLFGPRAVLLAGSMLAEGARAFVDPLLLPSLWRAMFLPQRMPPRFEAEFPFALAGNSAQMIAEAEDSVALGPGLLRSMIGYPTTRARVEILGGDADLVVLNAMHGLRAAAMMPNAMFHSLPSIGHMLHHICPEAVAQAVRRVSASELCRSETS